MPYTSSIHFNSFNIILAASVDYMHAMKTITLTNAGVWILYDKLQKWIDKKHINGKNRTFKQWDDKLHKWNNEKR